MVTRKTKTGKTMYGTVYQGEEAWSMDRDFVQDVENGKSEASLEKKEKITFLNKPNRARVYTGPASETSAKPDVAPHENATSQRLEVADRVHDIVEIAISLEKDLRN